jgi:phosphatidylglycerophosphatase C
MPNVPTRPVAAFDFDGTLTYKDSFVTFLVWKLGYARIGLIFVTRPGMALNYLRTRDRGALKIEMIYNLLGPISQADFKAEIAAFAEIYKHKLFRPDALEGWAKEGAAGHERVIVTASPTLLVAPFAEHLGADRLIGTPFAFDENDRLIPRLTLGANNRGPEKVRRLKEVYGDSLDLISAYGDTKGDFEMLKAARNAYFRVFKKRP